MRRSGLRCVLESDGGECRSRPAAAAAASIRRLWPARRDSSVRAMRTIQAARSGVKRVSDLSPRLALARVGRTTTPRLLPVVASPAIFLGRQFGLVRVDVQVVGIDADRADPRAPLTVVKARFQPHRQQHQRSLAGRPRLAAPTDSPSAALSLSACTACCAAVTWSCAARLRRGGASAR